ncbi:hypothetical protein BpHYR1_050773 [Brachionus plicatilis]|uniref:Uncharacterized protein n=1 Tax=Brachionus plicatilis TaxID=10195 RepID=A0A3M7PAC4_BRAPC|nr:hypothetical protein BpHYR1_050773 [Brachionus plicatilis]
MNKFKAKWRLHDTVTSLSCTILCFILYKNFKIIDFEIGQILDSNKQIKDDYALIKIFSENGEENEHFRNNFVKSVNLSFVWCLIKIGHFSEMLILFI